MPGKRVRGEVMISQEGIEGGAIYALSKGLREQPGHPLMIDFRPDLTEEALAQRLTRPRGKDTQSNFLRKVAGLTPVAINLLRETGNAMDAKGIKAMAAEARAPGRDHARHLVGRRRGARRGRRGFPAEEGARHLLRGRNAGLGSPHRRLSAAGLLLDRRGGGAGTAAALASQLAKG